MPKDACYKKVMRSYGKWSARAAQATAKCRKKKGKVRKTKAGSNLKRWEKEKWVDTRTGKACGAGSRKTPKTKSEMSKSELSRKKAEKKKVGMKGAGGKKVKPLKRK